MTDSAQYMQQIEYILESCWNSAQEVRTIFSKLMYSIPDPIWFCLTDIIFVNFHSILFTMSTPFLLIMHRSRECGLLHELFVYKYYWALESVLNCGKLLFYMPLGHLCTVLLFTSPSWKNCLAHPTTWWVGL